VGVSNRLIGFLAPLFNVSTECRCCISSITSSAVRFIPAETAEEFDRRFDEGEDIHDLIDMSKANIIRHGKKVRITLDIAEGLFQDIDRIRKSIGTDRRASTA